jgi:hypothetical protein
MTDWFSEKNFSVEAEIRREPQIDFAVGKPEKTTLMSVDRKEQVF